MELNLKNIKKTLANINKLFRLFVDDYGSMILEAKRKAVGEEPEIKRSKARNKHDKFINEQMFKQKIVYKLKTMKKK